MIEDTGTAFVFEAESPGLSVFVVGADTGAAPPPDADATSGADDDAEGDPSMAADPDPERGSGAAGDRSASTGPFGLDRAFTLAIAAVGLVSLLSGLCLYRRR